MTEAKKRARTDEDTPEELKGRPEGQPGMSDYDEGGGTGLEPQPSEEVTTAEPTEGSFSGEDMKEG